MKINQIKCKHTYILNCTKKITLLSLFLCHHLFIIYSSGNNGDHCIIISFSYITIYGYMFE